MPRDRPWRAAGRGAGRRALARRGSHMRWNHRARALRPNDPPPGTYPTATLSHAHTARFVRAKDSIDLSVSQQETLRQTVDSPHDERQCRRHVPV